MKAVLTLIYNFNNRANTQEDTSVEDYWNILKGALLDTLGTSPG